MVNSLIGLMSPEKVEEIVYPALILESLICLVLAVITINLVFLGHESSSFRLLTVGLFGWQMIELIKLIRFVRRKRANFGAR